MAKSLTTTTAKKEIYAFFFHQRGLMAGLGLQGTKITRINRVPQRPRKKWLPLRDLQTNEIAATFADRDMKDADPLELTRLTLVRSSQGHHGPVGEAV